MSNTSKEMSASVNSDAIDAVTEGINRVGILDSKVQICANCGKEGSDITNTCNKCESVMYCNAACKKKHRHKHKKECERRIAELYDEQLFKRPQRGEDCPICFLRLPSLGTGSIYLACCGKVVCSGCIFAVKLSSKKRLCPFCRTPPAITDEDDNKREEKRIELGDAIALNAQGSHYSEGKFGYPQSHTKALELWHRGQLNLVIHQHITILEFFNAKY